jgi:hypothetical protein
MPVPMTNTVRLRLALLLGLALLTQGLWGGVRGPQPTATIPLEDLGYEPLTTQFLLAGSSMLTVHFVDEHHLLITFSVKRLLKRLPDCPPGDQDRSIDAILLEIPSGKVLAKTTWRVHDRGQYIWSLGHGRFILRVRNSLTTFAPLANIHSANPFIERPLLNTQAHQIDAILLSPDSDLLVIESREPKATTTLGDTDTDAPPNVSEQVDFFRVAMPDDRPDAILLRHAGQIFTTGTGTIPANSAGYVAILDQGRQHWAFDFRNFNGKVKELSAFGSTCRPKPVLVSRSEFIAFGCHQGNNPQVVGGFNLRGEEMWEQSFPDSYVAPVFVFAPSGGRFAMSRLISHAPFGVEDAFTPDLVGPQTVVVYQIDSGRQILRVDCSPIERAGQNFSLSPDGLDLAIIRNDAIELYDLPPLTPEEQKALQQAKASAPEDTDVAVQFNQPTSDGAGTTAMTPSAATDTTTPTPQQPQTPPSTAPAPTPSTANLPEAPAAQPADAAPVTATQSQTDPTGESTPRQKPTLYTLPGENPGNQAPEEAPQQQQPH